MRLLQSPLAPRQAPSGIAQRVVQSCTAALAANALTGERIRASARKRPKFDSSLLWPLQERGH